MGRHSKPAVSWTAVGRVAIAFLLLAGIKLFGFALDWHRIYVHQLLEDLDVPRLLPTQHEVTQEISIQPEEPSYEDRPKVTPLKGIGSQFGWKPYDELTEPNIPQPNLDWVRCAFLHNTIVQHGWLGHFNGTDRDPSTRNKTTWWDTYGEEVAASGMEQRLGTELIAFLKLAQMPEEGLSFTYDLRGLAAPGFMFEFLDEIYEDNEMLVLYEDTTARYDDGMGLLFYQPNNYVHYQPYTEFFDEEANWFPLELALGSYLGQIETGKFVALPQEKQDGESERNPWAVMPWETRRGIELTVKALELLIQAIWERMPADAQTEQRQARRESRMISKEALRGLARVPENSFLFQFLTRAPGCPFEFIAPGIRCPTDETIAGILSEPPVRASLGQVQDELDTPVLVFPADERIEDLVDGSGFFRWWNATLTGVRGGLYMDRHDSAYQDGVQLVTPFSMVEHGWARTGDGREIQDRPWRLYDETYGGHGQDAYTALFQMGTNALQRGHHTNLFVVLQYWLNLIVEDPLWQVGPDGVEGGMEVFRMADTEEHWWRYCIQPHLP